MCSCRMSHSNRITVVTGKHMNPVQLSLMSQQGVQTFKSGPGGVSVRF